MDSLSELRAEADRWTEEAWEATEEAGLKKFAEATQYRQKAFELSHSLVQHSKYAEKPLLYCERAWGVVLSVDIRGSTARAVRVTPQDTLVTMHVYMQAMLRLVSKGEGLVIGLRGDGLLAVFGHRQESGDLVDDDPEASKQSLVTAVRCGNAMLAAVGEVVNPALKKRGFKGDLVIGVGIDCGRMVVTKIGIETAFDVTAYGACVNHAAKGSSSLNRGHVLLADTAEAVFPKKDGGKIKLKRFCEGYHEAVYPYRTLT